MIQFLKQIANDRLRLKPGDVLRERWLDHVRNYPRYRSKPDPGPFVHDEVSHHVLRRIGLQTPFLRRQSGMFLPSPQGQSADKYKIWERPGETHTPSLPHSLLGQEVHDTFFDYHPSFSSRASFVLRVPNGSFHG